MYWTVNHAGDILLKLRVFVDGLFEGTCGTLSQEGIKYPRPLPSPIQDAIQQACFCHSIVYIFLGIYVQTRNNDSKQFTAQFE